MIDILDAIKQEFIEQKMSDSIGYFNVVHIEGKPYITFNYLVFPKHMFLSFMFYSAVLDHLPIRLEPDPLDFSKLYISTSAVPKPGKSWNVNAQGRFYKIENHKLKIELIKVKNTLLKLWIALDIHPLEEKNYFVNLLVDNSEQGLYNFNQFVSRVINDTRIDPMYMPGYETLKYPVSFTMFSGNMANAIMFEIIKHKESLFKSNTSTS